jgi:signal peptidase I
MDTQHIDQQDTQELPAPRKPGPASRPSRSGPSLPRKPTSAPRAPRRYPQSRRHMEEARRLRVLREVVETVALTVLIFLAFRFVFQNYRVDGHSMVPTFQDQQYILVNRAAYLFHPPERGDVIVFEYPIDPTQDYIKRIMGIPGDHVQVDQEGVVTVNGVRLREPYVSEITNPYQPTDITLKADQYFVLGDNRGDSSDSRVWGTVPRQNIIGKAWMVYWPLGNFHVVPDASAVFAAVKP